MHDEEATLEEEPVVNLSTQNFPRLHGRIFPIKADKGELICQKITDIEW